MPYNPVTLCRDLRIGSDLSLGLTMAKIAATSGFSQQLFPETGHCCFCLIAQSWRLAEGVSVSRDLSASVWRVADGMRDGKAIFPYLVIYGTLRLPFIQNNGI
jgi:hypothetical protein